MINQDQLDQFIANPKPRKRISIIRTTIIKESSMLYETRQITTPRIAAGLARKLYENADREMLIICSLNTKCSPLSLEIAAIGSVNSCIVSPREVFKNAILSNAASIIVFHNHPTGDCTPSVEDLSVTKCLIEAGELLGIPILDHIIIGDSYSYLSLREKGIVSFETKPNIYMK